jgi:hypothetical protein
VHARELKWGLGKGLESLGGRHERKRSRKLTGGGHELRRARANERKGVYRPNDTSRRFRPSFVAYSSDDMGAGVVGDMWRPTANGERWCAHR